MSMRKQIKEQQISLLKLEKRVKERKFAEVGAGQRQNQLKIPPGKMVSFFHDVSRLLYWYLIHSVTTCYNSFLVFANPLIMLS